MLSFLENRIIHILIACAVVLGTTGMTWAAPDNRPDTSDLVLYEVFVRQFSPKGTLVGFEDRMDEIEALGVNAFWLMPIQPIGKEGRKGTLGSPYAVRSYRSIDPDIGHDNDLRGLVQNAHEHGHKVLMDFVPNHTAWDNTYVYARPDWYAKDENGDIRAPNPAWGDVAQLDYSNEDLRREMYENLSYWIEEFNIDGFRFDVAGALPDDFWTNTISQLRQDYPDLILLAEANGPKYHELGFDLSYDEDLRNTLWRVVNEGAPASEIGELLERQARDYPDGSRLMRYTENHDLERTAAAFAPPAEKAAVVAVMMLPGVPLIYAGQEYGLTKRPDLFEKDTLDWRKGNPATFRFYQQLIKARKENPAMQSGTIDVLPNNYPSQCLSFMLQKGEEKIVVIVNLSDQPLMNLAVECLLPATVDWVDVLPEWAVPASACSYDGNLITVTLPPYAFIVAEAMPPGTKVD